MLVFFMCTEWRKIDFVTGVDSCLVSLGVVAKPTHTTRISPPFCTVNKSRFKAMTLLKATLVVAIILSLSLKLAARRLRALCGMCVQIEVPCGTPLHTETYESTATETEKGTISRLFF